MSSEPKIENLTPAIAGWWAKFTDETEWYSPVAAWALCEMKDDASRMTGGKHQLILPVLTSEAGMTPHHEDQGYCELLFTFVTKSVLLKGLTRILLNIQKTTYYVLLMLMCLICLMRNLPGWRVITVMRGCWWTE
ncbi:TPA: hypothetical protein N3A33_000050 [Salmonella enterica subsp. salamae serovar 28:r:e,n,z15]|nr:hypothetical protein [Salmonella enterica subsp. salamae serovar 28:r:e,n,z15]